MFIKAGKYLSEGNRYLVLLVFLSLIICFWRLGDEPLHEWDESRNGVNAIEMLNNGDLVNLYYGGLPDTWNAKPPLLIWLIALSFKVFGFNEFALRFPSALAAFISFIILFQLIRLYTGKTLAFITCLMLLTVSGIAGIHVGRTGDFDALLYLFLILAIYYFLRYTDFSKKRSIITSAVFMGFAFYTKGPASLIILPGLFCYLIFRRKLSIVFKQPVFWIAALVFIIIVSSWFVIAGRYGLKFNDSIYGTGNSMQTMWKYDVIYRLLNGMGDKLAARNYAFFFTYIDVKFNVWNYVFYLSVVFIVVRYFINRRKKLLEQNKNVDRLLAFSVCIFLTVGLFLSLAAESHFWYMTPALPFIAIFTSIGMQRISAYHSRLSLLFAVIIMFTFARKVVETGRTRTYPALFTSNINAIRTAGSISVFEMNRQDYLLFLMLNNRNVNRVTDINETGETGTGILITNAGNYKNASINNNSVELLASDNEICLVKLNGRQ